MIGEGEPADPSACVGFLRRLLATESLPGQEEAAAELVAEEMRALGYDEVRIDEAGNVLGVVRGRGEAPAMMFNTHLDHVDAGDPERWPHPPFGGELADGRVWGRGAVDIKGPLAAQVHGAGRLAGGREPPAGDVWVSAVVQEEVGGLGARHLAESLPARLVVIGEPSSNRLRRGHRGRIELRARFRGRSAHASAPDRGVNPLRPLAAFLLALEELQLPEHPELGRSTLVPTLLATDQRSANVIPGEVRLTLDGRTVPGQTAASVRERLLPLLERSLARWDGEPGADEEAPDGEAPSGAIEIPTTRRRSWTGLERVYPADNPPFVLPPDHPALAAAAEVLLPVLGQVPPADVWRFATDGGHFAAAGATVIGFGPGEEALAHTVRESIRVAELEEAVDACEALARAWPARVAAAS